MERRSNRNKYIWTILGGLASFAVLFILTLSATYNGVGFAELRVIDWLDIFLVPLVILVFGFLLAYGQAQREETRFRPENGETIQQRINQLTSTLSESARVIEAIDTEIENRHKTVKKLQKDTEIYNRLKNVNQAEIEAVAQVLEGPLRKEGRRSFWTNFAVNFVFFIVGAAVSAITTLFIG